MHKPIVLASTSPRRIEIMGWLGVPFRSVPSALDEKQIRHEVPEELTRLLAEAKARAVVVEYPDTIVIGSDALVSFKGQIFEKPINKEHQRQMLDIQKGQEAKVYASVCVIDTATGQKVIKTKQVAYKMSDLTSVTIEAYIAGGSGLDKAGGFGLQDENGLFIDKLEGCFTSAMGFPICEVAKILRSMEIPVEVNIEQVAELKTGRAC